jgi:MFS family permease
MEDKNMARSPGAGSARRHSQFVLLGERRFWPLFLTQFLGAFNDNAYKNALMVLLTFGTVYQTGMKPEVLTNLAAGLFILPFFLFSATAGQLADKFDKARLARVVKALEIIIILLAGVGFWLQNLVALLAALCLLGLQSTLFGPVKYAILPQHLRDDELVGGNALVEAGTFVSILLGTLVGGLLAGFDGGVAWIAGICLAVALGGFWASCRIPAAPAPVPELKIALNPLSETWHCIGFARRERSVFLSVLGISWFWAYGSLLLTQLPAYTKSVLGGGESTVTLLLTAFSAGIGSGSLLCDRLTQRRGKAVEPGLAPLGALGMTLFGIDIALIPSVGSIGALPPFGGLLRDATVWRVCADLFLLGAFGGIYCVPLYALVQQRSPVDCRARVIAANNIINALFMVAVALGAGLFLDRGHGIPALLLGMAVLHGLVTIYIFSIVPEFLIRALIWLGFRRE